jgi:hypothetical protein
MKSLEHIIREIREGKAAKGDKKNLEHSIRKVVSKEYESSYGAKDSKPVEEDVGGLIGSGTGGEPKLHAEDGKKKKTDEAIGIIGSDDYKGRQFNTSIPKIEPPDGTDRNIQTAKTASRSRIAAKERQSMTLHGKVTEEEQIAEYAVKPETVAPIVKKAAPSLIRKGAGALIGGPIGVATMAADVLGAAATGTELGRSVGKKIGQFIYGKPETKSFDKTKETKPGTAPETRPKQPEVKPFAPGAPIELPKTAPKPEEKPKVAPAPATTPAETPSGETKPKLVVLPKIDVPGEIKPETATTPKTAPSDTTPKTAANTTTTDTTKEKPKFPGIGGLSVPHNIDYTVSHLHRPNVSRGHAKSHRKHSMKEENERKEIENMPRTGDRKSIEYVGRKDAYPKTSKQKTSRLATIKNVIDEAKRAMADKKIRAEDGKTKVYDYGDNVLVINPDQKRINLDVDNGDKIPKDYDNK